MAGNRSQMRLVVCLITLWVGLCQGWCQTPLTSAQAVAAALENNLDLWARKFDLKVAEARKITAQMSPNPTLSVGADHLDLLGTGYNASNAAGPPEYSLRTDFTLEGGGKRGFRMEVAELARQTVELQLQESARQLILEVQNAFTEVLLEQSQVTLAQESRRAFDRIVKISAERVRAGDLARVELVRTQLAQLQFETEIIQSQARLKASRHRLLLLMGRPVEGEVDLEADLLRDPVKPSLAELVELALQQRPDYRALLRDGQRAEAEIRLEEARGKIDYTVGLELRRQQGLAGTGNSLGFFLSLPLPAYDTNEGEIERARQEHLQIQALAQARAAQIKQELASAWERYWAAQQALQQIETRMLGSSRQVLETLEFAYRRGQATLVELLDAQRAYTEVNKSYYEARAELARARFLLEATCGHGGVR